MSESNCHERFGQCNLLSCSTEMLSPIDQNMPLFSMPNKKCERLVDHQIHIQVSVQSAS